ncbi:TetR/AcrR family transcriptional regulator [Paraflavitalea sp. CAU 1676]|uniref:TetR/AcrR family transcriptional regulator n=1 Tax=Paraflavitalea sp. CAU 1676 TaxID=3032598 RepID=UPI0023DBB906|nr:TetR/AcrR family transcriptional regulator [Paraflavitalea sp. CAU 1676]MDF2187731.1 TetR/AcrR family transcriptional regulator [Paraflavitalea sp. CAU 1676]
MAVKDSQTEQQIKDAARKLFFTEGRFNATTQEIADAAGVNRTLVNYYFRSRDLLFDQILREARATMDMRLEMAMSTETSFRKKIEHFIDIFMEQAFTYPYLDTYMVTRINEDVEKQNEIITDLKKTERLKNFLRDIEAEIKKGTIEKMEPVQFLISLISLLSHPVVIQPLFKKLFQYSDRQYKQMLLARKEIILKMLFK